MVRLTQSVDTTSTYEKYLACFAGLSWGLNPGPPTLEASTLPLGYQGGNITSNKYSSFNNQVILKLYMSVSH